MSLFPETIPPESLPFGVLQKDGRILIDHNWYLFLFAIAKSVIGTGVLSQKNGGTGAATGSSSVANNLGALAVANNLSDVANAATSRTNLGLGSIATQNANAVSVTGGSVNGTTIGATTAAAGTFTSLNATSVSFTSGSFSGNVTAGSVTVNGVLKLGAYTGGAPAPTGYLTVQDSSGTTRQIPCA